MTTTQLAAPALVLLLAAGCTKPSDNKAQQKPAPAAPMNTMKPWPKIAYKTGHALTPKAALLAWLKKNATRKGGRTLFRLPVVVKAKEGFTLGRRQAFVGSSVNDTGTDKLHLSLDDGAMGISFNGYVSMRCGKSATACALWLEGHWGPLLQRGPRLPPTSGKSATQHPFAIRNVGEVIKTQNPKAMIAR